MPTDPSSLKSFIVISWSQQFIRLGSIVNTFVFILDICSVSYLSFCSLTRWYFSWGLILSYLSTYYIFRDHQQRHIAHITLLFRVLLILYRITKQKWIQRQERACRSNADFKPTTLHYLDFLRLFLFFVSYV